MLRWFIVTWYIYAGISDKEENMLPYKINCSRFVADLDRGHVTDYNNDMETKLNNTLPNSLRHGERIWNNAVFTWFTNIVQSKNNQPNLIIIGHHCSITSVRMKKEDVIKNNVSK